MKRSKQQLTQYLLGELSEAQSAELEQSYFSEPQLFEEIVAAENDLVDSYARGQLSREERQRFETYYLSHPARQDRAAFAGAMTAKIDQLDAVGARKKSRDSWSARFTALWQRPALVWAFSLAMIAIVAGGAWLAMRTWRSHQQAATIEAERKQQEREQSERDRQQQLAAGRARSEQATSQENRAGTTPTPAPAASVTTTTFATLALNINGIRGVQRGPAATLVVAPGTEKVRLHLTLQDNEYSSYSILIQTADSKEIFKRDGLRASGKTLTAIAPATAFASGDYILTLRGVTATGAVEDVSKSLFHVERQSRTP